MFGLTIEFTCQNKKQPPHIAFRYVRLRNEIK
jgi:hypothetical protein